MSSQKNLQRRSQSSIRNELARDLHDSIAQDLVALGYQIDLLTSDFPASLRNDLRKLRKITNVALTKVRRELFALREEDTDLIYQFTESAGSCNLEIIGDPDSLTPKLQRIVHEVIRNAATYSKGHTINLQIESNRITIQDDGRGMYGVAEAVAEIGGSLNVESSKYGTKVVIELL